MPEQPSLTTADRRQRTILRIGAVYDAGFGIPIFFAPNFLLRMLNIPQVPPDGMVWIALDGIFLVILGIIYWIMSGNPSRYLALIGVILLGKVASIAFYLTCVFVYDQPRAFLMFAALDAVMAALHFWALGPDGIGRIKQALQPLPAAAV